MDECKNITSFQCQISVNGTAEQSLTAMIQHQQCVYELLIIWTVIVEISAIQEIVPTNIDDPQNLFMILLSSQVLMIGTAVEYR